MLDNPHNKLAGGRVVLGGSACRRVLQAWARGRSPHISVAGAVAAILITSRRVNVPAVDMVALLESGSLDGTSEVESCGRRSDFLRKPLSLCCIPRFGNRCAESSELSDFPEPMWLPPYTSPYLFSNTGAKMLQGL